MRIGRPVVLRLYYRTLQLKQLSSIESHWRVQKCWHLTLITMCLSHDKKVQKNKSAGGVFDGIMIKFTRPLLCDTKANCID